MTKSIKVTDIKWAYNKELNSDPVEEFINHLCLFVGEIIRSDEIGLILWKRHPALMVRVCKVDLKTEETHIEILNFKDSKLKDMLVELKLTEKNPSIVLSAFEVFCYRPRPNNPYHPKIHPTYNKAREKASRVVDGILLILTPSPATKISVSFAQVDRKASKSLLRETVSREQDQEIVLDFVSAVDNWLGEFYTDRIGSRQYKTKNRYPLAPKPIESSILCVITSDEDGNLIYYQTDT